VFLVCFFEQFQVLDEKFIESYEFGLIDLVDCGYFLDGVKQVVFEVVDRLGGEFVFVFGEEQTEEDALGEVLAREEDLEAFHVVGDEGDQLLRGDA
jgi:hypothetical protein